MLVIQYSWVIEFEVGNCRKLDYNIKKKVGHNVILRSLEFSEKPLKLLKAGADLIKCAF